MGDIQHIPDGGYLLSKPYYKRLKQAERDLNVIESSIAYLEEQRGRQNEELDYWLNPDGGHAQKLREAAEQEEEWLREAAKNPIMRARLRKRLQAAGIKTPDR